MGFWYILCLIAGVALYVKFTFFSNKYDWKYAISFQLQIIGILLFVFALFMLSPVSNRIIDILFP